MLSALRRVLVTERSTASIGRNLVVELRSCQIGLVIDELKLRMRLKLRRVGIRQQPSQLLFARNPAHARALADRFLKFD